MAAAGTVPTGATHRFKRSGVADEPDLSRLVFRESDVSPRLGLSPNDAYDLALFKEQGSNTRGVLVVTMVVQLQFQDGRGTKPGDEGRPLVWTKPDKTPSAHEAGHMLGIRDEYVDSRGQPEDNPHFTADNDSIMHEGDDVRERHYANFADWLNQQFETASRLSGEKIEFKVNGTLSASDAKLS